MLVGRRAETEVIDRLLAGAREGRSGTLVVRGEAGIGKSALLAYAVEHADGMTVLRGTGIQSESELAFAGVHQLLRPVLDRIERLPEPQAAALRAAFALSAETVDDRFRVALGVLGLLCEVAEERPLLCLVDDAQWLDQPSSEALLFAARRLQAEPLAVVFAAREDMTSTFPASGVPDLDLDALDASDARALLAQRSADATPERIEWLVANAKGNPLALIELAAAGGPVGPLAPATSVEQTYLERIRALPPAAAHLLVLAAAEETGDRATILRAAAELGLDAGALAAAEDDGLVRIDSETVEFHHPLVRSAAYRGAGFAERERAHAALASVLSGESNADRRAWHRAAATVGPDDEVAAELEQTAARARLRGGASAASAALARAADLSGDDAERGRRLVLAATAANLGGQAERATALAERARPLVTDPILAADLATVRGGAEILHGLPENASDLLAAAAEAAAPHDPGRAFELCVAAIEAGAMCGDAERVARGHRIGGRIEPDPADDKQVLLSIMLEAGARVYRGDADISAPLLREGLSRFSGSPNPRHTLWAGVLAIFLGDENAARALNERAVTQLRLAGALGILPHALANQAVTNVMAGNVTEGAAQADEARRLAHDLGAGHMAASPLAILAWTAALQGREDECRELVGQMLAVAGPRRLALAPAVGGWALAELDLSRGRWDDALAGFTSIRNWRLGFGHPHLARVIVPNLVEAAVRAGRPEAAAEPFADFRAWTEQTGSTFARPRVERCRALLADNGDAAVEHYEEALRLHLEGGSTFEHARTQLLYGELLRRLKKRSEARVQLRAALQTFEHVGAASWVERAQGELRATGETARKRIPSTLADLTPQELQIARLVGEGASNKDVAAQLFLSPRTVEYHLRKVFQKLGISSRTELIRLGVGAEPVLVA